MQAKKKSTNHSRFNEHNPRKTPSKTKITKASQIPSKNQKKPCTLKKIDLATHFKEIPLQKIQKE